MLYYTKVKRYTLPIKIILAVACVAAVVAWSALFKTPPVDVRAGAVSALEQMQLSGIQRLDAQILAFDQQLNNIETRKTELEQILPQTEKWFTEKKVGDYSGVPCG
jgi:hypothetical protein